MRRPLSLITTILCCTLLIVTLGPVRGADPEPPAPPPPPPPKLVMEKARTFTEHGRVVSFEIDSAALGSRRKINLYLPPGYDQGEGRYPVVYLLRGHEFEWLDNVSSASRKGRNAAIIADDLIMSGAVAPMILVMPPLSSLNKEIIALGVNLASPKLAKGAPGVGPGRFEDFLVREVIPTVDTKFRTLPDRRFRGVDGFSLGGFSAISLAMRFPDLFASAGAYEGSFVWPGGVAPNGKPDEYLTQEFAATYGTPPDLDLLRRTNPLDLVDTLPAADLQRISFHIQSTIAGKSDQPRAAVLVNKLQARGAVNTFTPMEMPGSQHGWYWADEHLKQVLPMHAAVFLKSE